MVDQVAGREHTGDVGPGAGCVDLHVTLVVQVDLALEQLAARVVADRDEHAGHVEHLGLAGLHVAQPGADDLAVLAQDLLDDACSTRP